MQLIASNLRQNENGLEWRIGFQQLFNGIQDVGSWSIPGKYTGPFQAIVGSNSIHTCKSPLLSSSLPVSSLYSPQFPSASIEIINNAGHFLHVDQAESVKKSITKFLSSLSN
jgi:pimeloyl-ACP methyl ester carboxylesterase